MALTTHTLSQRPEVEPHLERLASEAWPRFLQQHDERGLADFWPMLFTAWAHLQFVLREAGGAVVAGGHAVPFAWNGTPEDLPDSLGGILARARGDHVAGCTPNALAALAAFVDPRQDEAALGGEVLSAARSLAFVNRLGSLVAPVRPTLKTRYPLTRLGRYVRWTEDDGAPLDPWMRAHWRFGAEVLHVIPQALVIVGTVAEWEGWTEMRFPESGHYVVPGALEPVTIDREKDEGRYDDPGVWVRHAIE